ncbi:YkgJ family cysteine cluster protein [Moraxella sp. ZY200743]|uniref:YkgJ family cysteine cluster protein n=1 Tax=Moraxella sp. ZY200743 TaxID=2911970 RepID=UPI003D7E45A5
MTHKPFPCIACGLCCRHVYKSEQTAFLNKGDGICQFLDTDTNLCQIYETRPLVCQVERYYQMHFQNKIDWETFVNLNLEACHQLQNQTPK